MNDEQAAELRRAIEAGFRELRESVDRVADAIDEMPASDAAPVLRKLEEIRQALGSGRGGIS